MVLLNWLLGRPELSLRLVTGNASTTVVEWAHPIELLDPTPWLTGDDLVLTVGLEISQSIAAQAAYVDRLAESGASALGFGVGVRHVRIPEGLRERCGERGLPLVEVPMSTPFVAVSRAVAEASADQRIDELRHVLERQRTVTRSAVRTGLRGVVAALARALDVEAVVLDEYGAVMATSTRRQSLLNVVDDAYLKLSAARRPGTVAVEIAGGTVEIQAIRGRSAVCGWLAVLHRKAPTHTDRLLLNQAVGLMTLQLDWPTELIAAYHGLGGALLSLLLDDRTRSAGLELHLHHFGFEVNGPVVLVLVRVKAERRRRKVDDVLSAHLEGMKRAHVVAQVEGGVAVLLLARDTQELVAGMERELANEGLIDAPLGVSPPVAQSDIASALPAARIAADAAENDGVAVRWFREVSLGPLLADPAVRQHIRSAVAPAIDALTAGGGARDSELLTSLAAFLHNNGSWDLASRSLGIHRHTLRNRIDRVEKITGLRTDRADHRALLLLGVMSLQYDR